MRIFTARIDGNWSPQISVDCPYCHREVSFYTQLANNKCKYCWEEMPFPSRMAKDLEKRVEYHVETEAEDEPEDNVHFMYMREGD